MHRRSILWGAISAFGAAFAAYRASAASSATPAAKLKVVYHLNDLVAGADDKIFRVDRAELRECAELVTDRKELAALRRK